MKMRKVHDDNELFMTLTLESVASGLSRKMVLNKRKDYLKAFFNFNVEKVAGMTDSQLDKLLKSDSKIIKNRNKVFSTRDNAKKILELKGEFGSFGKYVKGFAKGKKNINHDSVEGHWVRNKLIDDMKFRGFKFIGKTSVHIFLIKIGVLEVTKVQKEMWEKSRN